MKKFSMMFSVILVFVVVFASCSKDDDDNTSQNQIVGKWQAISRIETLNGKLIEGDDLDLVAEEFVIEFNSNLSYTIKSKNIIGELGTYIITGGTINFTATWEESDYYSLIFNISDNKLFIYYPFGDYDGDYLQEIYFVKIN